MDILFFSTFPKGALSLALSDIQTAVFKEFMNSPSRSEVTTVEVGICFVIYLQLN